MQLLDNFMVFTRRMQYSPQLFLIQFLIQMMLQRDTAFDMFEICNGKDLCQWSWLEIRLNGFPQSTIPQKQFIIIFIITDIKLLQLSENVTLKTFQSQLKVKCKIILYNHLEVNNSISKTHPTFKIIKTYLLLYPGPILERKGMHEIFQKKGKKKFKKCKKCKISENLGKNVKI